VSQLNSPRVNTNNNRCAAPEDFEQIFAKQNTDLLRLSLQLTVDAEKAETCLVLAMRDCFFGSSISISRAHAWARRMVIRNAIRLVWGTPNDILCNAEYEFYLQPSGDALASSRESIAILGLPVLDRLVFVICVLERYSIPDCAVILGKTPCEVREMIVRSTNQVISAERRDGYRGAETLSLNVYRVHSDRGSYLESSCGSIFDL
jgi:DNA-directed RNA polymerase specialized sigma24 family protein